MNKSILGVAVLMLAACLPIQAKEVSIFKDFSAQQKENNNKGEMTKLAISNFQGQPLWRRPIKGIKATALSSGKNITALVVLAENYHAIKTNNAPQFCADAYPENTFSGEIVVCQHSDISAEVIAENLRKAGAGGMILQETKLQNTTNGSFKTLPSVAMSLDSYFLLKNWVKYSKQGTAIATIGG